SALVAHCVGYSKGAVVKVSGFSHPLRRCETLPELMPLPMVSPGARLAATGDVPAPRKALPPLESKTEKGKEFWKLVTPLTDHPVSAVRRKPAACANNGRS